MESVKGYIAGKVRTLKDFFNVPPISESMAMVIIIFVFTNSVATSIWMSNAWTPFIFTLFSGSNVYVGLMAAAHGLFDLVFAMLTGYVADTRFGPSRTLRFAVQFGFFNLLVVMVGMWTEKLWILIFSQCCEGIYMGLSFPCMESVFAQCQKRGDRDRLYSLKFCCEAAGPIIGIFLTLILYGVVGDHWEVGILRTIMTFGVSLHMASMMWFLYYFKPMPWVKRRKGDREAHCAQDGEVLREGKANDVTIVAATVVHDTRQDGGTKQLAQEALDANTRQEEGKEKGVREKMEASGEAMLAVDRTTLCRTKHSVDVGSHPSPSGMDAERQEYTDDKWYLIDEDDRLHDSDEDSLPMEDGTSPMEPVGPSTEYANLARTAIISSAPNIPPTFSLGGCEPSVCTPAPESREEVLSDLCKSFSFSLYSTNRRNHENGQHDDEVCPDGYHRHRHRGKGEGEHHRIPCDRGYTLEDGSSVQVLPMASLKERQWSSSFAASLSEEVVVHNERKEVLESEKMGSSPMTSADPNSLPPFSVGPHGSTVPLTRYVDTELEKATGWRRWLMKRIPFMRYPIFVVASDTVIVMGSGMTTQYFTLFMMTLYDVDPTQMALLNLSNACLISILAIVVGMFGRRHGRIRAILPPKMCGALILLWMALARGTTYAPKWLMCIAFVLRTATMNCSSGLTRALIMDLVAEHLRGRWNAIESIQSAGWSGTALLGGYLADRFGYGTAFIFTFFFHMTGICIFLPLAVRNDTKLPVLVVVGGAPYGDSKGIDTPIKINESYSCNGDVNDASEPLENEDEHP